jgi:Nodulation protein Z (NodZ)
MAAYVVNRPYPDSNVGSNLASLAGALWLAQRLGRELIVDWRGQRQLRDVEANYFAEFLALPEAPLGVRVSNAPVAGAAYDEASPQARWLSPGEARAVAVEPPDDLAAFVVLQPYHGLDRVHPGPEQERLRLLRAFYRELRPAPRIAAALDHWWREHVHARFVIALNVRTGNGQYFRAGERYQARVDLSLFEDERRFLRLLERACRARLRGLPRSERDDFQIFYATDSGSMSDLLTRLPNSVTRRRVFPPPGSGDLYAFGEGDYTDRDAIEDTIADMFLLARCDALVWNTSMFNQYARVVTDNFGGNQVHFEWMQLHRRARLLLGTARRRLTGARGA